MKNQNLNFIIVFIISISIIAGWHYWVERPKMKERATQVQRSLQMQKLSLQKENTTESVINIKDVISSSNRVHFSNSHITGTINLKGLRIDDLTFQKYKQDNGIHSEPARLLGPQGTQNTYFVELGWIASDQEMELPTQQTIWKCDKNSIGTDDVLTCQYNNNMGFLFKAYISIDDNYMFNIKHSIENYSEQTKSLKSYAIIHKAHNTTASSKMSIVHEGFSGVLDDELQEISYKEVKDKKKISSIPKKVDWFGINDKYWLVSIIPNKEEKYTTNANFLINENVQKFQADVLSDNLVIQPGSNVNIAYKVFTGAKELELLDNYEEKLGIKLFDRTVDFGWFYILTKPLLHVLHFFHNLVGNFGLSIMIVTVLVKLSMFSLANKSFKSMKMMKNLAPQVESLKSKYSKDQMKLNQEIMSLYKRHNVNPLSGCLPLLIQIPVFFSLYKVLNVSIDMRHAPFFGWISDLSAPDPTNIFNLFGLIPFDPPSFLQIGLWPIFMSLTMYWQQKLQPPPTDPAQAQVMSMMPLMFLCLFSSFPAGLLIYWTWNNILSVAQQTYINSKHDK